MRSITGKLTLSAALIAFAGAAQAGNEGAYTLMPVETQSVGANYVAPVTNYIPQPSQPEVGEIIYNTVPTTAPSTGIETTYSSDGSITSMSSDVTVNSDGSTTYVEDGITYTTQPISN